MVLKNEEGYGVIYKITNVINGKMYIGQTTKTYINDRWCQHKNNARNGKSSYLYNAIRKYGEENFKFKVLLHKIPIDKLDFYEQLWIYKLRTKSPNGYNLTDGGGGTRGFVPWDKGIKRSKEDIAKMKAHFTPEVRERMRQKMLGNNNPMYGRCGKDNPAYGKRRYGKDNPFYGKHHSEETKAVLSKAKSSSKQKVAMLDIDTEELVLIFDSYSEAAKYLRKNTNFVKADDSAISRCARGIYKYVYGHKWKKIESINTLEECQLKALSFKYYTSIEEH